MTRNPNSNLPPLSSWLLGAARLTAFPSPVTAPMDRDWWKEVVGRPPETRTVQPKTGEQRDADNWNEGILSLEIHPIRIEWQYSAPQLASEMLEVPSLGSIEDALDPFQRLMNKWLRNPSCPPFVRVAFGTTLLRPVDDIGGGYELLAQYIPVELDTGSSDFLYQINRRRPLDVGIPLLEINRLSRWSVMRVTQTMISPQLPASAIRQIDRYACRLELDINTVAEYENELPQEQLAELFGSLIEQGKEIAAKGDIP
jgi:hypothetical protein